MTIAPYDTFQNMLSTRDCNPELTSEELRTVTDFRIGEVYTRAPRIKELQASIPRLIQPIIKALDLIECRATQTRNNVIEALIHGMAHYQRTYWGWSNSEWEDWLIELEQHNISEFEGKVRLHVINVAYLLCGYDRLWTRKKIQFRRLADRVFGQSNVISAIESVSENLTRIGYSGQYSERNIRTVLCLLILMHRTTNLSLFRSEVIEVLYHESGLSAYMRPALERISHALFGMGILSRTVSSDRMIPRVSTALTGVPEEWVDWCKRWQESSNYVPSSRYRNYITLLQIGRWLAERHPDITSPDQWTRDVAIEFVASVDRMHKGQYALNKRHYDVSTPMSANAKKNILATVKVFFQDLQEWGWIKRHFDPYRSFKVASHIIAEAKTPPRVVPDEIWAKLVWAGLNLTEADIEPYNLTRNSLTPVHIYPIEMLQALVTIWLFAGLRSDEIRRLQVGCIRWQPSLEIESINDVCLLEVPANKTGPAFTKPVDGLVGRAVEKWEQLRPDIPAMPDYKTGQRVHYLFVYRARRMGKDYINKVLIPILCKKAGIPLEEARGKITSHRARSTIATQLFNAKDPMSLFELQAWLGHNSPNSTQRYVQLTPNHLTQAYSDAEYFKRNLRRIDVLIDQEAVLNGTAMAGEPWKFYDLGHGYCTYDFFDQCPHRMACAKCDFYRPKDSSQAQLVEAKSNLQRMLQEIPLTDEECSAVEDGLDAIEQLIEKLVDVPTPSGQTPRELRACTGFIPLDSIVIGIQSLP